MVQVSIFDVIFLTVSLYDEVAIISDIVVNFVCDVKAVTLASEHEAHISPK
jgi:hypothetical protein